MENKEILPINQYPADDEIDLFELFSSLMHQWKWLVGITVAGALLSIVIALMLPKQYEVTAQVAVPNKADVAAISVRGYGAWTPQTLFNEYYRNLSSAEEFKAFIKEGEWLKKIFPENKGQMSEDMMFSKVWDDFSLSILAPLKEKGAANDPSPNLVAANLWTKDEALGVSLLNDYIAKTNTHLIEKIARGGKVRRVLEVERIQSNIVLLKNSTLKARELAIQKLEEENQRKIKSLSQTVDLLREKAKKTRLLGIKKREEGNKEKVELLTQSINLLIEKFDLDNQAELLKLNEALDLAIGMGIKRPKTIESFSKNHSNVSVTTNSRKDLFLMGSDYLRGRIKNAKLRNGKEVYLKEIPVIRKQIEEIKNDIKLSALKRRKSDDPYIAELPLLLKQIEETKNDVSLAALKARTNDDPYIAELPALLKKLDKLQKLSFNFNGVKLYRLDKKAIVDGKAEKPKRALIVAVGTVLAFFAAIFAALIMAMSEELVAS